jgi:hypothetical protein
VAWEGEVWLFFKARRWDFSHFPRNYSFGESGCLFFLEKVDVFSSFVIWRLNEDFSKENIL